MLTICIWHLDNNLSFDGLVGVLPHGHALAVNIVGSDGPCIGVSVIQPLVIPCQSIGQSH